MLNNTSATIYNKSVNYATDETVYHRTVIPAVHWEDGLGAAGKGKNHAENRSVFVSIDFSACSGIEKPYLPAHQFSQMAPSQRSGYWTLAVGDILLKGTADDDIPPGGIKRWMAEHPEAASITSVETFDMGSFPMQHWEVNAK